MTKSYSTHSIFLLWFLPLILPTAKFDKSCTLKYKFIVIQVLIFNIALNQLQSNPIIPLKTSNQNTAYSPQTKEENFLTYWLMPPSCCFQHLLSLVKNFTLSTTLLWLYFQWNWIIWCVEANVLGLSLSLTARKRL